MTKLPQKLPLPLMQTQWAQTIDPIITNPLNSASVLKNISLVTGANVVNHKLGANLQGWYCSRIRAAASIYDTQDTNQTPQLTLNLVASAPVVVDLVVF
jgi:hypothetical protein